MHACPSGPVCGEPIVLGRNLERKPRVSCSRIFSAPGGNGIRDRRVRELCQGSHDDDNGRHISNHHSSGAYDDGDHRDRAAGYYDDIEPERR